MNTYYIIKVFSKENRTGEERFHYFGKGMELLGYITDSGVKRYSNEAIKRYGFKRPPWKKLDELRAVAGDPHWSDVITLVAETIDLM